MTSKATWNLSSCLNSFTNDISNLFNSRFLRSWSILQNCKFGWLTSEHLSIHCPWILFQVLTCLPVCHASSLTACCCWDETIRRRGWRNIWGWEDVLIHVQTKCQLPSWNSPSIAVLTDTSCWFRITPRTYIWTASRSNKIVIVVSTAELFHRFSSNYFESDFRLRYLILFHCIEMLQKIQWCYAIQVVLASWPLMQWQWHWRSGTYDWSSKLWPYSTSAAT